MAGHTRPGAGGVSIRTFIDTVYNRQRLHSVLAYLAPETYEVDQPTGSGLLHAPSQTPLAATLCG